MMMMMRRRMRMRLRANQSIQSNLNSTSRVCQPSSKEISETQHAWIINPSVYTSIIIKHKLVGGLNPSEKYESIGMISNPILMGK